MPPPMIATSVRRRSFIGAPRRCLRWRRRSGSGASGRRAATLTARSRPSGIGLTGAWLRKRPTRSMATPQRVRQHERQPGRRPVPGSDPCRSAADALTRLTSRAARSRTAREARRRSRPRSGRGARRRRSCRRGERPGRRNRRPSRARRKCCWARARSSCATSWRSTARPRSSSTASAVRRPCQFGRRRRRRCQSAVAGEVDAARRSIAPRCSRSGSHWRASAAKAKRQPARSASCVSGRRPNDAPTASHATRRSLPDASRHASASTRSPPSTRSERMP